MAVSSAGLNVFFCVECVLSEILSILGLLLLLKVMILVISSEKSRFSHTSVEYCDNDRIIILGL